MKRICFPPSAFHFLLTAWVFLPGPPQRGMPPCFHAILSPPGG
jgi:hypothetical protein